MQFIKTKRTRKFKKIQQCFRMQHVRKQDGELKQEDKKQRKGEDSISILLIVEMSLKTQVLWVQQISVCGTLI